MSDFKFNCPHCEQPLEAPKEMLGQTIECPSCKGAIELPAPAPQPKSITPVKISKKKSPVQKGCGFLIVIVVGIPLLIGIFSGISDSLNTTQSPSRPSSVASTTATKQKPIKTTKYNGQPMVRVCINDDTQTSPVHAKAEIWSRGNGSWWLKPEMKYGGTVKVLETGPIGIKQTLVIYPESRNGKELKVPYMITDEMNPKGSPRDMISVDISDTEIIVHGLPIKAASGQFEIKYKR